MCGAGPGEQSLLGRRLDRRQGFWPRRKSGISTSVFRCRGCGLVYPNPMPIPGSIAQHYNVEPESYWPDDYFHIDPDYFRDQIETFARLKDRPAGGRALDIGAGLGKAMVAFERAGFEVEGIEPSEAFRRAAIERMKIPADRLRLASVEEAEFPDDSFDFINFGAVVEHLVDPAATLAKTIKWLNPDGLMYVEVPSSAFLMSRVLHLFYRMTFTDYVINISPMHAPYHLYEFGLESFVRHGEKASYSVAFHEYYPCASYVPSFLIPPLNFVMRRTGTGMQLAVWLRKK